MLESGTEANDRPPEPVPALFEQCLELYEAMADEASMQTIQYGETEEGLVYEGFLTHLVTDSDKLNYSTPMYTKLTRQLKAMDCMRQLKRGGSTAMSRWLLLQPPTLKHFRSVMTQKVARPSGRLDAMDQQIRDLNERLTRAGL